MWAPKDKSAKAAPQTPGSERGCRATREAHAQFLTVKHRDSDSAGSNFSPDKKVLTHAVPTDGLHAFLKHFPAIHALRKIPG